MPRIALILVVLLSSCLVSQRISISGKGDVNLTQVEFSDLAQWENDDHKKAIQAFIHSCNKFAKMPQSRLIGGQIGDIKVGDFRDVCDIADLVKTMSNGQAKNFFENWFRPFLVETRLGRSTGLFTGYYEASLNGSKVKTEKYQYPLYAKPRDLTSEPYFSRAEIEDGALDGKGLELLYVDNKADLFFMHIQGSGRIKMDNGAEIHVAFAAKNNQPFSGISNYLVDHKYLNRNQMNAESVRNWLKANPDKADEAMNINSAYTFFRIADGEYIVGGQGVPLTAERSLAVDSDVIPYGMPLWLETNLKKKDGSTENYSHLFIAQDTGSAIKGTIRGDIFFGYGDKAEELASYTASQGRYFILLPVNVVEKIR
ncbi:MAG: MltA domain-containing protein [Proteobacteria bacterium]|nr:MltA domain-containing protein [Pseudomonadota bacterium]